MDYERQIDETATATDRGFRIITEPRDNFADEIDQVYPPEMRKKLLRSLAAKLDRLPQDVLDEAMATFDVNQ